MSDSVWERTKPCSSSSPSHPRRHEAFQHRSSSHPRRHEPYQHRSSTHPRRHEAILVFVLIPHPRRHEALVIWKKGNDQVYKSSSFSSSLKHPTQNILFKEKAVKLSPIEEIRTVLDRSVRGTLSTFSKYRAVYGSMAVLIALKRARFRDSSNINENLKHNEPCNTLVSV
ncbi:unnamed protein product [Vicia faba]|uniref:Uncharacterized protein n=1 Tax=Vicia faba TaxID=3906 RepID=A0AAV0ZPT5_VICFA|nr:unnamed protein product [Vicia faba]